MNKDKRKDIFFIGGFLGSKDPTPPAITTFGVWNLFPLVNIILKRENSPLK